MTTPPPAEAPESADRTPPASDASSAEWAAWLSRYPQLVLRSPDDTASDAIKDAMALYGQARRVRALEARCARLLDALNSADARYHQAYRDLETARMSLRQLLDSVEIPDDDDSEDTW